MTACFEGLLQQLQRACQADDHAAALVSLSLSLGLVETSLTSKTASSTALTPASLQAEVGIGTQLFHDFVADVHSKLDPAADARAKVTAVANAVWARLSGAFSKDIMHGQHLSVFTSILGAAKGKPKRQLDCGGVVTTIVLACLRLSAAHGHADLKDCRFQVSEDHCWLSLDGSGKREASAELTTTNAAKRGAAVDEAAWKGWLYSGGSAHVCRTPAQLAAALVTSVDPCVVKRKNGGTDSEELQALQLQLLSAVERDWRDALYPAAICTLADLLDLVLRGAPHELRPGVSLQTKADDALVVQAALHGETDPVQALFEGAVEEATVDRQRLLWYPHAWLFGYLTSKAELLSAAAASADFDESRRTSMQLCTQALSVACAGCAAVLLSYRHVSTDEQLYKDIEEVLEGCSEAVAAVQATFRCLAFTTLLLLWDGICCYMEGRSKPATWIALVMRAAKKCSPEERDLSAHNNFHSDVMRRTQPLWKALKSEQLRPLFETPDVVSTAENGHSRKRQKR